MKSMIVFLIGFVAIDIAQAAEISQEKADGGPRPPAWAYPVNPPTDRPPADDGKLFRVPGSSVSMTRTQALDRINPPDWHPQDHPPMPSIVKNGNKDTNPKIWGGCGYCHLPNGHGRPENSSLAGLPIAYFVQQMADYKNGLRKTSETNMSAPRVMAAQATLTTETEWREAAEYFAVLKLKPWVRVVETRTVPKAHVSSFMYTVTTGPEAGFEPIGKRILEVAENHEQVELRDTNTGFVAYVPVGSIKRGKALATANKSDKPACTACHGSNMKGLNPTPALAGRSPSYLFRQLYDFKSGARKGAWSESMTTAVAELNDDDMLALAAYLASLPP